MPVKKNTAPPEWARKFLRWYCPELLVEEIEGDLLEYFQRNLELKGKKKARISYAVDVARFLNPSTFKKAKDLRKQKYHPQYSLNPFIMWYNYMIIAIRNFWRQKSVTAINVIGLAVSLTSCLLIGLFLKDEWKFDRNHPDKELIYRITTERGGANQSGKWAGSSPALGPTLVEEFPEIESSLRLYQIRQKLLFEKEDFKYLEDKGFYSEQSIFDFFHLPFKFGDPGSALNRPNSIVLTEQMAKKYFGNEDPVGQSVSINGHEVEVSGVLENILPYFHLDFEFLLPFENLFTQVSEERMRSWVWQDFVNYIKRIPESSEQQISSKLPAFIEKHAHPQTKEYGFHYYLNLQKITDIHLHSAQLQNDVAIRGNYRYAVGLGIVGLFLLLIACINFINLTTAKAMRRSKEVGIRKVSGAMKGQLAVQFVTEAIIIVAASMVLAIFFTHFALPYLNKYTGKNIDFPFYSDPLISAALIGLVLITGILAGSYPAFVMSGFKPVTALTGSNPKAAGHVKWLRKGLVVTQFALSVLLIISVLVIFQQVRFLNHKNLGFDKEQLMHFTMKRSMFRNFDHTKEVFNKVPGVVAASTCFGIPGDIVAGDDITIPGEDRKTVPARIFTIDHEYISTIGMEIIAGRDFSKDYSTDATEAFIINETAVKNLGLGNSPEKAIGKPLEWLMWTDQDTFKKGLVIGVVKDFHYQSLHEEIETVVMHIYPDAFWKLALRIETEDFPNTIAAIEDSWDSFDTGYPFDYQFTDESFGAMYQEEQKLSALLWVFTMLAIFIACIGAFGLASYAAEQRRKEISIRKILGATEIGILGLLSKDFLKLVCIACILAIPFSWHFMSKWLNNFPYRINMEIWVFAVACLIALIIAALTISFQSIRAAKANPVNALRNE